LALAILVTLLRFYTRSSILKNLHGDDWALLASLVNSNHGKASINSVVDLLII
jgi:hypothetical protein